MDSGCHPILLPHEDGSCVQPPDASKPHVRWCGRMPGRNPRHPTRSFARPAITLGTIRPFKAGIRECGIVKRRLATPENTASIRMAGIGLEISKGESALPAFLRDKSRAP